MERTEKLQKNPINQERGAALIMVLCVMAILLSLSLMLLLAGGITMRSAIEDSLHEQTYLSARSFSEVITQELAKEMKDADAASGSLREFLDSLPVNTYPPGTEPVPAELMIGEADQPAGFAGDLLLEIVKDSDYSVTITVTCTRSGSNPVKSQVVNRYVKIKGTAAGSTSWTLKSRGTDDAEFA